MEYSEGEEDLTDLFIEFADKIEDAYPDLMVSGNPEGTEPRIGSFEISCEGNVLFSRLKSQRFPEFSEVLSSIQNLPSKE